MDPRRQRLLQTLMGVAQAMPQEQLREVADFADFLHAKHGPPQAEPGIPEARAPERGSPEALLRHAGGFRFEPGELERILGEIDEMRHLDLEQDA